MLTQALRELAPSTPIVPATEAGLDPGVLFAPAPDRGSEPPSGFAAHPAGIAAHLFTVEPTVTRDGLAMFMDLMAAYRGGSVLRLKGILDVDGRPTEIQGVMQAFHPPLPLANWPGGERRPRLVIVCDGLTRAELAPAIAALHFGHVQKGRMPGPETYARFRAIAECLRVPTAAA
jgi:G3E family GTPase